MIQDKHFISKIIVIIVFEDIVIINEQNKIYRLIPFCRISVTKIISVRNSTLTLLYRFDSSNVVTSQVITASKSQKNEVKTQNLPLHISLQSLLFTTKVKTVVNHWWSYASIIKKFGDYLCNILDLTKINAKFQIAHH